MSAIEQLDFCAAHGIEVVHFSEPRLLGIAADVAPAASARADVAPGSSDPDDRLRAVKANADSLGISLEVGMLSICPSATIFNGTAGPAEVQLARAIDLASALGSRLVRCVVGSFRDRVQPGGIEQRIADALD